MEARKHLRTSNLNKNRVRDSPLIGSGTGPYTLLLEIIT